MDPAVIALAFATIFLVELPDKTFIAALVLSTRYRPLMVWIGVGLAFLIQTLVGAVVLFRSAPGAEQEELEAEEEYAAKAREARTGLRAIGASFLVLFAAEWGDLSQLLTMSLVARSQEPVSVFIGAWAALLAVSGLAVILGRILLRYMKLSVLHYVGAGVCLVLAGATLYGLVT
jgi:putative Ca2+/H+ antiporter (TMEM165/GDT1 family)